MRHQHIGAIRDDLAVEAPTGDILIARPHRVADTDLTLVKAGLRQ